MKRSAIVALGLAGGLALPLGARAVTPDAAENPYLGIIDRNVFGLKPAPPPPLPPPPVVAPPQKITLTGIVKAFGKKQVFFRTPAAPKPGEPPKETSFMLSEGERAGEIEILEINEIAGTVRLKNHGVEQPLSLEKDGMKPQAGSGGGPAALPGVPTVFAPAGAVPGGGFAGGGIPGGGPGAALTPVPTYSTSSSRGAASIQRPLRVVPSGGNPQAQQLPPTPSPEEQIAIMELIRVADADKVARGVMPPLPTTEFTPPPNPQ